VAAGLACASPAAAFVRSRTDDTKALLYWAVPRATLELARPPESFSVTLADFQQAAQAAVQAWSYPRLECSAVELDISPTMVDSQTAGRDGHNRIVIRTGTWCRDPILLTNCHDSSQIAVTTVFSRWNPGGYNDGEILEADIEINNVDFTWSVIPSGGGDARDFVNDYDLASALTHEIGHFLGFAHTCLLPGEEPRFDDQGAPSPACTEAVAGPITDATMFPYLGRAEIRDRELSPDEVSATCRTYSARAQEGMCQVASDGGRAHRTHDLAGPAGALILALTLLWRGRRPVQSVARAATLRKDS
jgi:hypothetical protein